MANPYAPRRVRLEEVIEEAPNIKSFVLEPEDGFEFETGQFIELVVPGLGEAPFTPSSSPAVKGNFEVTVMRVGSVTERLHELEPGAELGVRGPLGKGYPLEEMKGREIFIAGGGVGLAPLRSLFHTLLEMPEDFKRIVVCYGARTPKDLLYRRVYDEWSSEPGVEFNVTVDEGDEDWKGNVGVVTTLFEKVEADPSRTAAVVCGPPIMMKFATLGLQKLGFADRDIYLSMEKNMSCGIGKCGHCRLGPYYVCKDGPVLTYAQVKGLRGLWD